MKRAAGTRENPTVKSPSCTRRSIAKKFAFPSPAKQVIDAYEHIYRCQTVLYQLHVSLFFVHRVTTGQLLRRVTSYTRAREFIARRKNDFRFFRSDFGSLRRIENLVLLDGGSSKR